MDFEVLANLSWRDALIAVVVLLTIYVIVVFLRINRLRREKLSIAAPEQRAAQNAVAAYAAEQAPDEKIMAKPEPEPLAAPSDFAFPWNEPPPGQPGQREIEALEREIMQLRKEVGGLRAEILLLREEQRREREPQPLAPAVSPLYSDAMQMAMQGHDASTISQHCGIARAEAELVVALVRNRNMQ